MMKLFITLILFCGSAFGLTEKKEPPAPPEMKVESTKVISKLKQLEAGSEVVLHHREPALFPDGRVIEVHYFSHKRALPDEARRASVGLKIWNETKTEIVVLNQDLDRKNRETLSSADSGDYTIKLVKMVYDDQITVVISPK